MRAKILSLEVSEVLSSWLFIRWKRGTRNIISIFRFFSTYVNNGAGYPANVDFFVIIIEFFLYIASIDIKAAKDKSGKQTGFEKNILPHKR